MGETSKAAVTKAVVRTDQAGTCVTWRIGILGGAVTNCPEPLDMECVMVDVYFSSDVPYTIPMLLSANLVGRPGEVQQLVDARLDAMGEAAKQWYHLE